MALSLTCFAPENAFCQYAAVRPAELVHTEGRMDQLPVKRVLCRAVLVLRQCMLQLSFVTDLSDNNNWVPAAGRLLLSNSVGTENWHSDLKT